MAYTQSKRTLLNPRHTVQHWRPTLMTDMSADTVNRQFVCQVPTLLLAYKVAGYSIWITILCITSRKWRHFTFCTNVVIIIIKQYNYFPLFTINRQ